MGEFKLFLIMKSNLWQFIYFYFGLSWIESLTYTQVLSWLWRIILFYEGDAICHSISLAETCLVVCSKKKPVTKYFTTTGKLCVRDQKLFEINVLLEIELVSLFSLYLQYWHLGIVWFLCKQMQADTFSTFSPWQKIMIGK